MTAVGEEQAEVISVSSTLPTVEEGKKVKLSSSRRSITKKRNVNDTAWKNAPKVVPGGAVVSFSRLPHGFFEAELKAYLSQFGEVTRLRVSRNPRTGASRHYAFVEFRHAEVARIVVETMHNYLLSGHLLQCRLVPEEQVHLELWKGANRKFFQVPWRKRAMKKFNASMEAASADKLFQTSKKLVAAKKQRCHKVGIEYDFDGIITGNL